MIPANEVFNRYNDLIKNLVEVHLTGLTLEEIKHAVAHFDAEIGSKRVSSHIKDIRSLISILEARTILKPEDVGHLETVARLVRRRSALSRIGEYKTWMLERPDTQQPDTPSTPKLNQLSNQGEKYRKKASFYFLLIFI